MGKQKNRLTATQPHYHFARISPGPPDRPAATTQPAGTYPVPTYPVPLARLVCRRPPAPATLHLDLPYTLRSRS